MASFGPQNCTTPPATTASDAGVAGAGVLLSFMITAGLALTLSTTIIVSELLSSANRAQTLASTILRKLLMSLSDQQLITGIGIQSVGLAKLDSMVPYHFFIIWMLSLLATATHLSSLLALVGDFRRDWVLRWMRQGFMFVNLLLGCVYGIYVLKGVMRDVPATLPIACVWQSIPANTTATAADASGGSKPNVALSTAGTIAAIAGLTLLFALSSWFLHRRSSKWRTTLQLTGLAFLTAVAIGAAVRIIMLSQAFGSPSVSLADEGEREWSFGQLVPMLMILLPIISGIEILRGEMNVPPAEDDATELKEVYQPNPFWGSRTNLVRS